MLLPFPASSAFSKGDLCCKKQLLAVISGEDPFFFCLTNQPFCAVWVQWRVTWNLQESYFKPLVFVPNVYEAKTWQGRGGLGHCHSPCCPWSRLDDSQLWAVPGVKLLFFSITDSIPLEGKWGSQICPFCCQPGFCWSQSWNYIFLRHHLKYFVHLKKKLFDTFLEFLYLLLESGWNSGLQSALLCGLPRCNLSFTRCHWSHIDTNKFYDCWEKDSIS